MMVSNNQGNDSLTTFQKKVLEEYQRYTVKYRVSDKNAHVTIRKSLADWLAQPLRRERYSLEVLPVHEQVALIDTLVNHLQRKRSTKATATRAANKETALREANKARQDSFKF